MQSEKTTVLEKGQLVGQVQEKSTTRTVKEVTPFGVKLELNLEGQFAGGMYEAQHIETVSAHLKMDGAMDFEAKAIETTTQGEVLVYVARGTGKQTGPTTFSGEAESLIMTQAPRLAALNNTIVTVEITANPASGEVQLKIFKK